MFIAPQELSTLIAKIFPDGVFSKETAEPVVALTIDDVGDPSTDQLLQVISQHNQQSSDPIEQASATFFITTSLLQTDDSILLKLLDQGHELGNHGVYDHTHANLSCTAFDQEFQQAHAALTQETNATLKWFRPGRGRYNKTMLDTLKQTTGYNSLFALASMIPLDTYEFTDRPDFTVRYVSKFVFPGSILVFHGGSEARTQNTAIALQQTLTYLREKQYRVVSLTELFEAF
ncbi:MAG: polysaccharide deacetylase family protein [Oscillatoriales cyanobacterium RM2_1_1]|nr:polysaccharide deacetylase family protein [Oscillatoriales cyanobacterium SM2_3_0]NJO47739.1 polysaccharide deacetylase family protein [Oscillatoriales cyanobacterium RM2_1_1]